MIEEKLPAPQASDEEEDGQTYWFVGAAWNGSDDQTQRFLSEGVLKNGYDEQFSELVRRMKPGDRIAIQATFVRKRALPFEVGGKSVSVMRIKAIGSVTETTRDGKKVNVAWEPSSSPR